MKHYGPLYQREVLPLSERLLVAEVVKMKCFELRPLAPLDRLVFHLRLNSALDEVPDR